MKVGRGKDSRAHAHERVEEACTATLDDRETNEVGFPFSRIARKSTLMKRWLKHVLIGLGAFAVLGGSTAGIYVYSQTNAYAENMDRVYDVRPSAVQPPGASAAPSTDAAVLARGKHLSESVGACAIRDCHGPDLGGGKTISMGPLGTVSGPNITAGGLGAVYTDGELWRLIVHGIKKDGRSVRFMPSQDFNWLPDSDITAIITYVRSVPAVERANGPIHFGTLAKVLDQRDEFVLDVARRINHDNVEKAPPPAPTAAYGRFIARLCQGCHGNKLSGGPLPGAPPSIPIPTNITPHESGIKGWSYEDFRRLLVEGIKKDGKKLDRFMPVEAFGKFDETEMPALWAYLQTVPPIPFGNR